MATYNGEKYLREQVGSILTQLGENDELVVSDDGSTDSTIDILKSYNDPRIKIFINTGRHGVNSNFENALRHADGDYIFLSDQDDVWLPNKVDICIKALQDCDCIVHDCLVTDKDLNVTSQSFFKERNSGRGYWKNIYKNTYLGCCMAFKREILNKCLPIPNIKSFYHDDWIGSIADLKYKLRFTLFQGILFRRHESNTSCTVKSSKYNIFQQIGHRLNRLVLTVFRAYL